jgi:hypothetical protein
MSRLRRIEPEWLDELQADDPRALRARRDLTRVNWLMMQVGIMVRSLRKHALYPPRALLDMGAGDGTFMLRVAHQIAPRWPDVTVTMLDRQNAVCGDTMERFRSLRWRVEIVSDDVFHFLQRTRLSDVDIVISNLFLHHFTQEQLVALFAHLRKVPWLFVACEPQRSAVAAMASRLLWAIGCSDVTRHDAPVSVNAGFAGQELTALWRRNDSWDTREGSAGLFTHVFTARRT